MFIVKSYIHYPKRLIKDLEKAEKNPSYYFVDVNNFSEILNMKNDLDFNYIEGVIHLTYNDKTIMSFRYYDLIDQLWAYFLNMIEEFLKNNFSEMTFPDQPLPMSMKNISDQYILFSINFVQWKLPKYEFFNALLMGAKDFFEKMMLLIEEEKEYYIYQLNKIKKLESKIKALKGKNK